MHYVYVWVRSESYRSKEALTYQSDSLLPAGSIVRVPLRKERVLGIVAGAAPKPSFPAKSVDEVLVFKPLPLTSLRLLEWLTQYYASPVGVVTQLLLPPSLKRRSLPQSTPQQPLSTSEQPPLTAEQKQALDIIQEPDTYTIHGRTGSGKTRLYIELIEREFKLGKSSIVLCPEIGLTSQLTATLEKVFGTAVLTLHSQLTTRERETLWQQILEATNPLVVVGPRSALFSPVANLGLIIIDESHDQAYKQEQPPYYNAVRVASHLRQLHEATLVLGSATPSLSDYYVATLRHKPIIRLNKLARADPVERHVNIVDLKDRTKFTRSSYISNTLLQSIGESIASGQQSLLYLNRRGTARVTLCTECGWQAVCPHCDLPLTYHGDTYQLRCHTCGYRQPPVTTCPQCGKTTLAVKSFGTKAVVAEIEHLFPDASVVRFDTDNTKEERLEEQYANIASGNVDILVGTQMLAKGLDLPRLRTLGVLLADTSLYLPDYTARERTYQLITQVIGRIGRGHVSGHAIIQTYQPNSTLLRAALDDNWEQFYGEELAERNRYLFPPFYHLLKVSCKRASSLSAERVMNRLKNELESRKMALVIDGPAPGFHEKVGGKYRWQLVLKARSRSALLSALDLLPPDASYDLDPADLL